ncbi:MAG: peptidoglycan bridge formation glycyltransferase FemA/FemB family protein [Patescibacteria group bacterium]
MRPISISLSPNTEADDVFLALRILLQPWKWRSGRSIAEFERAFGEYLDIPFTFSFNSGRSAFLALLTALRLEKGDEVLVQAFTCNAVPNPVLWAGLKPVYVDCAEDYNMDPKDLEKKITPRARVVVVQHTFGIPAELERIQKICRERKLFLIEDCAHALGAKYKGKKVGTFGDAAFFSFSRDKAISCVYGGMALTREEELASRVASFRAETGYPSFFWTFQQLLHPLLMNLLVLPFYGVGGKYLLVAFQGLRILSKAVHRKEKKGKKPSYFPKRLPAALAFLALHQFAKLDRFAVRRRELAAFYRERLAKRIPSAAWKEGALFLRVPVRHANAREVIRKAWSRNLLLGDWYTTPIAPYDTDSKKMGYEWGSCPKAEELAKTTLNLPTHIRTSEKEAEEAVSFLESVRVLGDTEVRETSDKKEWERFLAQFPERTFLQSWEWGELVERMGQKKWRLGVFVEGELKALALVSRVRAKRGTFLLVSHGPVVNPEHGEVFRALAEYLRALAKKEGASFLRMNPLWPRTEENRRMLKELGFRQAPMHANAYEATWKLDLRPSEEELLQNMRKTTRYLIGQTAKNKDIKVVRSTREEDLEEFQKLNRESAERQRFVPFSAEFVKNEFDTFLDTDSVSLFLGTYRGELAAAALVVFWSGIAFYHQAASRAEFAKYSIPYLVQWEAIRAAKRRGCAFYDFWGYVDPKEHPGHPWAGPTRFKMGFGGQPHEYLKTQDLPLSWRYWPVALFESLRRMQRGL